MLKKIIIVGAGHAGVAAAVALRQLGFGGELTLYGDETSLPYQRPPLSKARLLGEIPPDESLLRPQAFYADNEIGLQAGIAVARVNAEEHWIELSDGQRQDYDVLILATGSRPRRIAEAGPGARPHYLRTTEDALHLKSRLASATHLAVVGGGYVGLEVAASARRLGIAVTILERAERLLARVASSELSAFVRELHEDHGVRVVTGAEISGASGEGVVLADGTIIPADAVLVGIGAEPCDQLAASAGLVCDNGVIVDDQARTSHPDIFAIGDMTNRPVGSDGARMRVESVANASDQAKVAAAAILGLPSPPREVPWFWSDQYDCKIQIAGLSLHTDRLVTRHYGAGRLSVVHLRGDRITAVECANAPADFMAGRRLIGDSRRVSPAHIENLGMPLRKALDTV